MASLQARHSRSCALGRPWTTFQDATKQKGCTCVPLYHVVLRHGGQLVREPVGHNRKEAERALDARRGDVARRTYKVISDKKFREWADEWVEAPAHKESTKRVYRATMAYAKEAFGSLKVREIEPADVRRFLDVIRKAQSERRAIDPETGKRPEVEATPATLKKHLRQLGACLQDAVKEGYANENPVRRLGGDWVPKVPKGEPAYYTDDELARLWPELAYRPAMAYLCKTAVATGMRIGELAALRWSDVKLLEREVRVSRTWVEGVGEQPPKSNKPRVIDLTPQAAAVLQEWYAASGGEGLVFEREDGQRITSGHVTKQVLYPALERAGIPREGEHGRERDFHSFRHTFARLALESGAEITWVMGQLGHSSITLTVDTYGTWSRKAQKAQAEQLVGVFPL